MSLTSHLYLEIQYPESKLWWLAAKLYHYGDTNHMALLAHPWGPWEPGDDLPKPVVKPRGVPKGLSIMVTHDYTWVLGKAYDQEARITTKRLAKRYKSYGTTGHWIDPDEWQCTTWLRMHEIKEADQRYRKHHRTRRRSPELAAMLSMMQSFERQGIKTRVVAWYG